MEKVIGVYSTDDFQLIVSFKDGKCVKFDMKPFLEKGEFKNLKNVKLFNSVYLDYDTVCWPGHLDISPETLYDKGVVFTSSSNKK